MVKLNNTFIKLCVFAGLAFTIASCSKKTDNTNNNTGEITATSKIDSTGITKGTAEGSQEAGADPDDLVESSTFTSQVAINFGTSLQITNPLLNKGVTITQTGNDIVINATVDAVEYVLSGTTTNGSVKIYSSKKFKVTMNGVNITSTTGPALNIQSSKRAFIVLADGSNNSLTDGPNYASSKEDMKGTIFAEGQLVFSGNGNLTLQGNYKHALCSDDYIRVRSGNITITGAVKDGIHTNNAFIADGGKINVTSATSDAIECEEGYVIINNGNLTLNGTEHGITASYTDDDPTITPYVNINGGTINVTTAGEGIESKSVLTVNGGNINVTASDNGLNAGTAMYFNGGNVYTVSQANDAIDSNGDVDINGGKIVALGGPSPNSGINCGDSNLKITGGIVVSAGAANNKPSTTESTINSVMIGGSAKANQLVHIEAADGTEALTVKFPVAYTTILYASAKLKSNTTYNVYADGSVNQSATNFNGLYTSGTYTLGTKLTSFTTTSNLTLVNETPAK